MLFEEAKKHLLAGEYVTRTAWDASGEYVISLPGIPYFWKILPNGIPNPSAGNWMPTKTDYEADDYKVFARCHSEASDIAA